MKKEPNTHVDTLKSRSRGASRDMSPDAINRRLDIVDELCEFVTNRSFSENGLMAVG
ncbi:MAG: hypothetical protein RL240_4398 [Planctomycetota bacterium]|jgi:hypothetical protein